MTTYPITAEEREARAKIAFGTRELARRIAMTGKAHGPCNETQLMAYLSEDRPATSPRQDAIKAGLKTYHGRPCTTCGATERLVSNADCRECAKARNAGVIAARERESQAVVLHAQARRKAMAIGQKRYQGRACGNCNGTERFTKNNTCCACQRDATLRCKGELAGVARVELERVAAEFNTTLAVCMSKTTDRRIVGARHAMWAQLRHRGYSFPKIAALFKVDHTTVQSAVRKVMGIAA